MSDNRKVLIIDGDCAFCNKSASFILKKNKKQDLFFAASQSESGIAFIQKHQIQFDPKKTLIFVKNNRVYDRSSAALQVSKSMNGLYPVIIIFWIVPKFLRDAVYNLVAKHRYKIVAKENLCSIAAMKKFDGRMI